MFTPASRSRAAAAFAALFVPVAAAIDFSTEGLRISIAGDGKVASILDTQTGVERINSEWPQYQPYLCVIQVGGNVVEPSGFSASGELLTFTFNTNPTRTVRLRVQQRVKYIAITVDDVTNAAGIEELRFVNLATKGSLDDKAMRFVRYDDSGVGRYLSLHPLDAFTRTLVGGGSKGGYLWAIAYSNLPYPTPVSLVGRKVALLACNTNQPDVYDSVRRFEADYNIPLGVVAKEHPAARRSCIFWMDYGQGPRSDLIDVMKKAGAGRMILWAYFWGDVRRKYAPNQDFWSSGAELKAFLDQCKANGIAVGAHLMSSTIIKDSIDYIRAGADPRLRRDRTLTLARDVPPEQTTGLIETTTPPTGWATADDYRDMVIGQEIIEYSGIKTSGPPYGLTGPFVRAKNQTGEGGLGPQHHAAGATVGHLVVTYDGYFYVWDIASGGLSQWCADIAREYDAAGFQFFYADDAQDVEEPHWYTVGLTVHELQKAMTVPPEMGEGSISTATFAWPLLTATGTIDYKIDRNRFKDEVDRNVRDIEKWSDVTGYIPKQLGWAQLAVPRLPATTPDDLEYILAKSAAYDMPVVYQMWMSMMDSWPHKDANLTLMARYEQLRLSGYLPVHQRLVAQKLGKDFMLFTDDGGTHHLVPVSVMSIGGGSALVRGFVTDGPVSGYRHATLWPTVNAMSLILIMDGLIPADVVVTDYNGNAIPASAVAPGQIAIEFSSRIYIKLANVPDPGRAFDHASVRERGGGGF
jgi:hypothetical protein